MTLPLDVKAFRSNWAPRLAKDPLAKRVIATLWRTRDAHVGPVLTRTRRENSIIDAVIETDLIATTNHVHEHFRALLALPTEHSRTLGANPLDFVAQHGVRRARGGVPLRAVLQAYRTGHKGFWAAMCAVINQLAGGAEAGMRTTMLLSDYCIDYTDLISVVVSDAYVAEEARLANERTRLSIEVVESLLKGIVPANEQGRQLLRRAAIADGRRMAIIVARCDRPSGDGSATAFERSEFAAAIDNALRPEDLGRLIERRVDEVVAIVSRAAAPGAVAAKALRAHSKKLFSSRTGVVSVGVGLDVERIAELPRSYDEARIAIDMGGFEQPVVHLAEISVDAYFRRTADATAHRLMPPLPPALRKGSLAQTVEAFAAVDLNVKACARSLNVHTNTIYHRLNQIERLTGLDPRTYRGLSQLITALTMASQRGRGESRTGALGLG